MGRARRLTYRGALHHATLRCNNKEFLFDADSFSLFLDVLAESREKLAVTLYNYCLMTNHVHLIFKASVDGALSLFMRRVANVFANRFNTRRERKGHLWEGRFRSTMIEPATFFLRSMAYLDLNPIRARMVEQLGNYRWSAHRHVIEENESLICLHPLYLALGRDRASRRAAYKALLRRELALAAYSHVPALFIGTRTFLRKMRNRFGYTGEAARHIEVRDLGGGAHAAEFRHARKPRGGRLAT